MTSLISSVRSRMVTYVIIWTVLTGMAQSGFAQKLWTEKSPEQKGSITQDTAFSFGTISKLAKELSPTVVNISVEKKLQGNYQFFYYGLPFPNQPMPDPDFGKGLGTGFIVNKGGYILTNNHVIEGADKITVTLANKTTYIARIVGADPMTDVALLKIEPREELSVAPLGDSDEIQIGDWVVAIGNPFGLSHTVTKGIVSAKDRKEINPSKHQMYANFIQTDASINPGNSGGPLINIRGEVIGINSAISSTGQGIGFAIPINMVKQVLPMLEKGKMERSWLGVLIQPVSQELADSLGLKKQEGALVAEVIPNGPSDQAGIRPGDIILEFNGQPVKESSDLPWIVSTTGIGKKVPVQIFRDSKTMTMNITLGALPEQDSMIAQGQSNSPSENSLQTVGIKVTNLTPELLQHLGMDAVKGVLVVEVDNGSAASEAGVRAYDIIMKVDNYAVSNVTEFNAVIKKISPNGIVRLYLRRGDRSLFVAFKKTP